MGDKILGIVHGVMPATGAAVAYRRCKIGMGDEDFGAGLVIGSNGREVTAVFAQAPGALQLLPSEEYGTKWLQITDPTGKAVASLPASDPYDEIYLRKDQWWGLIREEWLEPKDGTPISWDDFVVNIKMAKAFHRSISKKFHPKTYVFYGGGPDKKSFSTIKWTMKKGVVLASGTAPLPANVLHFGYKEIRSDGTNNIYVGGESRYDTYSGGGGAAVVHTETSFWEIRCAFQDSSGDGTVPVRSGAAPRIDGANSIQQQFQIAGIQHEPAYKNATVQQVTQYALTKLASLAKLA